MMNLNELRAYYAGLITKMRAIQSKADEEKRDLTDDELKSFETIEAECVTRKSEIERKVKLEDEEQRLLVPLPRKTAPAIPDKSPSNGRELRVIPATAYRTGRLKNFHGQDAEYRAYAFGQFCLGTLFGKSESRKWCSEHDIEIRALSEGVDSAGGFLVPEIAVQTIIDLRETFGVFRQESKIIPMGSDHITIPRRSGGLTANFIAEGASVTESDKSWNQVTLTAKKVACRSRWSRELDWDAVISIGDDLAGEIATAFARKEDDCGFLGDGTSTFGGMFGVFPRIDDGTHTASIHTALTGNTAFSSLDLVDFEALVGSLPQYAEANAKWYISKPGYWASIARLVDAAGGNTTENLGRGPERVFLGFPVVISQVLNSNLSAQTSTVICAFGDLRSASTFGDRRGMTVDTSEHFHFDTDQISIRGIQRFDINVHDLGDNTDAGPLVGLKTPGS